MAEIFGEAVQLISADDTELRATLKKDEALVRTSTAKMQASFDSVKTSATAATGPVVNLSGAAAGLGVAGAASGSAIFGLAGQLTSLVAALGPVGIAITVVSAAIFGIIKLYQGWNAEVEEAGERNQALTEKLNVQLRAREANLLKLRQQIQITRGEAVASDFIGDTPVRELTKELEKQQRLAERKKQLKLEDIRLTREFNAGLRKERDDKIRILAVEKESFELARKARLEAESSRVSALGPSTAAQATFQINRSRADEAVRLAGQKNLLDALRLQVATSRITLQEAAKISQRLGIRVPGVDDVGGPGNTARGGSFNVSQFAAGGSSLGSVVLATSIPPGDKKQIAQNDSIIKALGKIVTNTKTALNREGQLVLTG